MARTFNCGIGMIVIASPDDAPDIADIMRQNGETVIPIGEVVPRADGETPINVIGVQEVWR
jgi:phosphoribosylformylglycinamidine cyclo-ligase